MAWWFRRKNSVHHSAGERTNLVRWMILTGEYPPQRGGVSDYTRLVAEGLAALGDEVTVYAPPQNIGPDALCPGVQIRRLPDRFSLRGLRMLDQELTRDRPDRLLIQYVPHAFGLKAMNLPFAAWVAARASRVVPVWVMFHEVVFPFVRRPLRHNLLAIVNRVMAWSIAKTAERVMVAIPIWGHLVAKLCPLAPRGEWMPVPCNVATHTEAGAIGAARSRHAPNPADSLVGHFGTFGRLVTDLLEPIVIELLRLRPRARVLFIGRGSDRYLVEIAQAYPELSERMSASGELTAAEVAAHLGACDVLVQPYIDGVSSRRGSVMAGLANGVPLVTNLGPLSEPLWATTAGATVVPGPDPPALVAATVDILDLPPESRAALGARGAELYRGAFTLGRTIAALRDPRPKPADLVSQDRAAAGHDPLMPARRNFAEMKLQ